MMSVIFRGPSSVFWWHQHMTCVCRRIWYYLYTNVIFLSSLPYLIPILILSGSKSIQQNHLLMVWPKWDETDYSYDLGKVNHTGMKIRGWENDQSNCIKINSFAKMLNKELLLSCLNFNGFLIFLALWRHYDQGMGYKVVWHCVKKKFMSRVCTS
jgi:hypothetical protein